MFIKKFLVENFLFAKSFPRKQVSTKNFHKTLFGSKFFYGCKTISSKTGLNHKLSYKFFGLKFWWLQNHFLENRFEPKIFIKNFWSKIFYCSKSFPGKQVSTKNSHQKFLVHNFYGGKIISSELNMNQMYFGWHFFMVAKSFPVKQVWIINFHKNIFGRKFLWLQTNFLENRFEPKILIKNFFVQTFL